MERSTKQKKEKCKPTASLSYVLCHKKSSTEIRFKKSSTILKPKKKKTKLHDAKSVNPVKEKIERKHWIDEPSTKQLPSGNDSKTKVFAMKRILNSETLDCTCGLVYYHERCSKHCNNIVAEFDCTNTMPSIFAHLVNHLIKNPPPRVPQLLTPKHICQYVVSVQKYINKLQYSEKRGRVYKINPHSSMIIHTTTAKKMISNSKPIKCLEAVILAVYLTKELPGLERFAINFRSLIDKDKEYLHIVLGIFFKGHFGSIGISRNKGLMFKSLSFPRLTDLIMEFVTCYRNIGHVLTDIKVGLPITHNPHTIEKMPWARWHIKVVNVSDEDLVQALQELSKEFRKYIPLESLKPLK